ncbi:MAG: hypothetical protein Kow00121_04600 [Elainellaceae cyanobacterium]
MNQVAAFSRNSKESIRNSTLLLLAFATAFFPRFLAFWGAPSVINFAHFGVIPVAVGITLLTTRARDRKQVAIVGELIFGIGLLLACTLASALLNNAGLVNVFLEFMLKAEPFILLTAVMAVPSDSKGLKRFRYWFLGFAAFNLVMAIIQSILLPIGIYPKPEGGTLEDNVTGVFGGGGGSAGNYVSCTVSIYCALYFLNVFKSVPKWIRVAGLVAAFYQTQASDSKQVFLALLLGWAALPLTKLKRPGRLLVYIIPFALILFVFLWALQNSDAEFLSAYQNWYNRDGIFESDGEATRTKLAAFRIIPTYYNNALDWLFGLGPGHSVSRLGGWVLRDYEELLIPLGATIHPATNEVWEVINNGWIAKESTIYFSLFTWAGIWGDLGLVGLGVYLYLCSIVWRRICVDDFCKFLLLSTAGFGFILTQMEEPGHMLTIACLLAFRWHEKRGMLTEQSG